MSDADRRLPSRHPAALAGRIGFAPSRILDLSFGGALVETRDWLALGQRSSLRLGDPPFQLAAFVVRCRLVRVDPDDGRPVYQAGLSFDESPAVRQQLAGLVDALARDRAKVAVSAYS